jgi:predicted translin family RNA/ssDNA-binding protein
MTEPQRPLADIVGEVMAALLVEVAEPDRRQLQRQAEILSELNLSDEEFSPKHFLENEVRRALGL